MEVVGQIWNFLRDRTDKGESPIGLYGSRRCSKTWTISQFLLSRAFDHGDKCIFASMTETQGGEGAYEDCKNIIAGNPAWTPFFVIGTSPRRIVCKFLRGNKKGAISFRSFKDADTAKGAACDWVYINEANKFSLKQFYAITANARKGVIVDYNPEDAKFWAEDIIKPENLLQCRWQWNRRHLTDIQLQWFEDLKRKAESPNATSADVTFYRRYYLGEYAEIYGDIFTPANIVRETIDPKRLRNFAIVADPSNLTGADYFASVLVATDGARMYIIDALSLNESSLPSDLAASSWEEWCKRWQVVLDKWREWVARYDAQMVFCESNGVGAEFIRYARSEDWGIKPFAAKGNKHKRILENYNNLTTRVVWNETETIDGYLKQVFAYSGKDQDGVHDDNIDCANTAFDIFYKQTRMMV